jgi:hypothetical protein
MKEQLRIPAFVKLSRRIRAHRDPVRAALVNGCVQRAGGKRQHQDPADHPPGVRIPFA